MGLINANWYQTNLKNVKLQMSQHRACDFDKLVSHTLFGQINLNLIDIVEFYPRGYLSRMITFINFESIFGFRTTII